MTTHTIPLADLTPGDLITAGTHGPAVYLATEPHPHSRHTVLTRWHIADQLTTRTVPMASTAHVHHVAASDRRARRRRLRRCSAFARIA